MYHLPGSFSSNVNLELLRIVPKLSFFNGPPFRSLSIMLVRDV